MNKRIRKKWLKKRGLYVNQKETWNLDKTIARFVLPRLKLYKKVNNAYPGIGEADTPEHWDELIDKMIAAFELALKDDSDKIFKSEDWKENVLRKDATIQEGLAAFAKWYQYLWW